MRIGLAKESSGPLAWLALALLPVGYMLAATTVSAQDKPRVYTNEDLNRYSTDEERRERDRREAERDRREFAQRLRLAILEAQKRLQANGTPQEPLAPAPPCWECEIEAFPPSQLRIPADRRSWSVTDSASGNHYSFRRDADGTLQMDALNALTGSFWRTTFKPDGSMSGFDKEFRYWQFDVRTGNYRRSDGKFCFGKRPYRVCN